MHTCLLFIDTTTAICMFSSPLERSLVMQVEAHAIYLSDGNADNIKIKSHRIVSATIIVWQYRKQTKSSKRAIQEQKKWQTVHNKKIDTPE